MSEGAKAGREPPPVRLETVATATGLRSPATRLRGGDAPSHPSPTPSSLGAQGERGCGDSPSSGGGNFASLGVPASTARRRWGWGGERPRGHELAPTWLQSSQQGSWGGCKRGGGPALGPAAGGGGLEAGSGVCTPTPPPTTTATTTSRQGNGLTRVGCHRGDVPYQGRRKKLTSLLLMARACAKPRLGPVVGFSSAFQATILPGVVGAEWAGAEERTLLSQGS